MPSPTPPLPSPTTAAHRDSWYPYSNSSSHLESNNLPFILIFLLCALLCALALNLSIRRLLRSYTSSSSQPQPQPQPHSEPPQKPNPPLPPTLLYSSGLKLAGADHAECAICLSEFQNGEEVRVLPRCKHGFHVACIQSWLSSHTSCPTCRTTFLVITTSSPSPSPDHQTPVPAATETSLPTSFDVESQSLQQHRGNCE